MKKTKKYGFGGMLGKIGPAIQKAVAAKAPASGLKAIPSSLSAQQALFDRNMAQAAALPAAERAKYNEGFQKAAARGDSSTIRPGTTFGNGSGLKSPTQTVGQPPVPIGPSKLGAAAASRMGGMSGLGGMPNMGRTVINKGVVPGRMKKGGAVKASSASKRADGIATKGKTKGRMV